MTVPPMVKSVVASIVVPKRATVASIVHPEPVPTNFNAFVSLAVPINKSSFAICIA
jgi:hypothetical protein